MKKYGVCVGGNDIPVRSARASAIPLNKIWDGVQRPLDQTEIIYYSSCDIVGGELVEIEVETGFDTFDLRPFSLGITPTREKNTIKFVVDKPMQLCFEADGRHEALHLFFNSKSEIPDADDLIYFGPGEHKVDLLWVKSGQTIYIHEDAIIYGVLYVKDAHDIMITGRGVIDSSLYRRGNDFHADGQEISDALRQMGFSEIDLKYYGNIVINHCKDVTVEGVILKDAPLWSLIIRNDSENVLIDNVKIIGQWRYNSDGIDICTSKNITIKNSFVRSFDDCIVARGAYLEGEYGNVENLTVDNCVLWCDWGKSVEVWCGHKPTTIKNVIFKNQYLVHLSATAINITTWYGSDNSVIDGIKYENIRVDVDKEYLNPVIENENYKGYRYIPGYIPRLVSISIEKLGKMIDLGSQKIQQIDDYSFFNVYYGNISFDNVVCFGDCKRLPIFIEECQGVHKIENITATNCDFDVEIIKKQLGE